MARDKIKSTIGNLLAEYKDTAERHVKNATAETKSSLDKMNERINEISLASKKSVARTVDQNEKSWLDGEKGQLTHTFLLKGSAGLTPEQMKATIKSHRHMEAKTMVTYDAATGGSLIPPPEFVGELNREIVEFAPVYSLVRKRASDINGLILPKRNSILKAYWGNEGEALINSQSEYGEDEIPVHELTASTSVSNRMLLSPIFNIEGEITTDQGEAFGVSIAEAILSGDGVKKPMGLLGNINNTNSTALTLTAEILAKVPSQLKGAYADKATWLAHRETFGVIRTILATNAATFMLWAQTLAEGRPELLLGRPIAEAPELGKPQANGAFVSGQIPIIFGDLERTYTVADGVDVRIQRNPFRVPNKTLFEVYRYIGGKVTRKEASTQITITN